MDSFGKKVDPPKRALLETDSSVVGSRERSG
jgi:hypothetical protein